MTTTEHKDGTPLIEWERGDHVDTHDHVKVYGASGISADGREWQGTWLVTDGHHNEIEDIEEVQNYLEDE